MLAFIVQGRRLIPKNKPLPKLRKGWALIRVRLAGICNTDVEILRGYHGFRGTPGHELVGEVADVHDVSAGAKNQWLGQRVCGEINVSCSAYGFKPVCDFCRRGLRTHCARRTVLGIVNHDGAFAEYLALPLENLHVVPKNVTDEQAVFVEPLAAACEILEQVEVRRFREAAVLGDGKLAQLIARVLHAAVPRVVMYGKHEKNLALARRAEIQTKKVRGDESDLKSDKRKLSAGCRSYRFAKRAGTGSAHDRAAGHAGSEIHVPRRRARGNVAHRREGNYRGRLTLRAFCQSHRPAAFRKNRSYAAHHAQFSSIESSRRHSIRAAAGHHENHTCQ